MLSIKTIALAAIVLTGCGTEEKEPAADTNVVFNNCSPHYNGTYLCLDGTVKCKKVGDGLSCWKRDDY